MEVKRVKCRVVMLEIKEKTKLRLIDGKLTLWYNPIIPNNISHKFYNLYIISDDEIKINDWVYNLLTSTTRKGDNRTGIAQIEELRYIHSCDKKIIATTDELVCKTINTALGVTQILPQPSASFIQAFIKAYNELKPITEVLVEYNKVVTDTKTFMLINECRGFEYQLKVDKNNEITITKLKDSWSREEVKSLIFDCLHKLEASFDREKLTQYIKNNL